MDERATATQLVTALTPAATSLSAAVIVALAITWLVFAVRQRLTGAPGLNVTAAATQYTKLVYAVQRFVDNNEPFVHMWFGTRHALFACTPDAARFVLHNRETFVKNERFGSLDALTRFAGDQLVNANGDAWRRQRRVIGSGFHRAHIRRHCAAMNDVISRCLDRMHDRSANVDAVPWISNMALDVLGTTLFGQEFAQTRADACETERKTAALVYSAYSDVMAAASSPLLHFAPLLEHLAPFLPILSRTRRSISFLTRYVRCATSTFESTSRATDSSLLKHMVDSGRLTEDELRGNWFILFVAGHETTAAALSWLVFELATRPRLQQQLFDECSAAVANCSVDNDPSTVVTRLTRHCPLLNRVLRENLRHHPPLMLMPTRVSTRRVTYTEPSGDDNETVDNDKNARSPLLPRADAARRVTIPHDALVGLNIYGLHHNPAHWSQPHEFDPGRFLPERSADRDPCAYIPFSTGARRCVGAEFSLCEQRLFVCRLLTTYRLSYVGSRRPQTQHPVMGGPDRVPICLHPRSPNE